MAVHAKRRARSEGEGFVNHNSICESKGKVVISLKIRDNGLTENK